MISPTTLEARLRDLSQLVRLRRRKLSDSYARVDYDAGVYTITLPPAADDDYDLRTFLHELVHIACGPELSPWATVFQEDFLERSIEPRMIQYIIAHPARHAWWLRRLRKLSAATPANPTGATRARPRT